MIRLVTLNLWQEQGPWERRLALAVERLSALAPDVVCLQEVREVPGRIPNQAQTLARGLGWPSCTFEPAQAWGGGDEGVAVISRLPLLERRARELPYSEGRSRRVCLGACLGAPSGPFWVYTTHLAFRLTDGALRELQVEAVDRFIGEVPSPEAAVLLAGDFNAVPEADEIRFLRGLTSIGGRRTYYQDAYAQHHPGAQGHTWCRENPYTAPLRWLEPDRRLDYIFVSPMNGKGRGRILGCRIVCDTPDLAGVFCSDHYGLLAEVSLRGQPPAGAPGEE